MLRNAAINTAEENRATLHRYIGTNRKSKHTPRPHCLQAGFVHAPFDTPLGRDLIGFGKNQYTYNHKCTLIGTLF